jgi:hypothetical protein
VTERGGRRRKQLLDILEEKRGYWKLKEEALGRTLWITRLGRGCGPVVRETHGSNFETEIFVDFITRRKMLSVCVTEN